MSRTLVGFLIGLFVGTPFGAVIALWWSVARFGRREP
jgi:ABC-type nitrate/sulfonate/bicarbonate transport system permease component